MPSPMRRPSFRAGGESASDGPSYGPVHSESSSPPSCWPAIDKVFDAARPSPYQAPEPSYPSRHSITSGVSSAGWALSDVDHAAKHRLWSDICQHHDARSSLRRALDTYEGRLQRLVDSAIEASGHSQRDLQHQHQHQHQSAGALAAESRPSVLSQQSQHSQVHYSEPSGHGTINKFPSEDSSAKGMGDVTLLDFWQKSEARVSHVRSALSSNGSSELPRSYSMQFYQEDVGGKAGDIMVGSTCISRMVFHPNAGLRMVWDILSAFAIVYDIITVPLMVFEYDSTRASAVAGIISTCFWLTDLIFTFFVGFYRHDGGIEMRMRAIAGRYLRTWFVLDLSMILADVVIFFLDTLEMYGSAGAIRVSKTLRTARIARFLRILRLTRIFRVMSRIEEVAGIALAASFNAFFNISKLMIGVAVFAHFIACTWYEIGNTSDDGWTSILKERNESLFYQYICAYHWTMAQFTPAPTDFHPSNPAERTFAVLVLFIGFVIFSSLLGSTAALISQARDKVFARMKELDTLRRFFVENRISLDLASRITSLARNDARGRRRIKESDIPLLAILPQSVQVELRLQVFGPQVASWTVFALVGQNSDSALADLCHMCIHDMNVNANEEVFHFGGRALHAIYILQGPMIYWAGPLPLLNADSALRSELHDKTPLAEACFWTAWDYRGQLTSNGHCELLKVDAEMFRRVSRKHLVFRVLREFATEWIRFAQMEDIDDLYFSFTSVAQYTASAASKMGAEDSSSLWREAESSTSTPTHQAEHARTLDHDPVIDEEVEKSV